jgi:4Fe-4S ferredoxin
MMEIEKDMEVEDSRIRCRQKTKETEKILDYDYKRCKGCSICVALCPKKALSEGPLQEIAKGLDAPPVLIDLDACAFCGMCVNFCPLGAFKMTIEDKEDEMKEPDKAVEGGQTPGTNETSERGEKASVTDISKAEAAET